jgi:hypothetical protein
LWRSGKKVLMLVIEDAKLPPPRPAKHATTTKVVYDVPGCMTIAARIVGTSSSAGLTIVQLRPPNIATANV